MSWKFNLSRQTVCFVGLLWPIQLVFGQDPIIPQEKYDMSYQTKAAMHALTSGNVNSNGNTTITLPIYKIDMSEFSFPISINYNTGGIKVSERPSIVGLGWNLEAGGTINRIVRGRPDEFKHVLEDYDSQTQNLYSYTAVNDVSYLGNYSKLNRNDWSQNSFINVIQTSQGYAFSNSVYGIYPYSVNVDLAPDEFRFNVNNLQGTFFLDHEGNWIVNSNQEVKVVVEYQNNVQPYTSQPHSLYTIPRSIVTITLYDEHGNKYIFGKYNNYSAIEYTRSPISSAFPYWDLRTYTSSITSVSWLLRSIVTANGEQISFGYKPIYQLNTRKKSNLYLYSPSTVAQTKLNLIEKSLIQTHIIENITSSTGISIDFITTNSTQLDNNIPINDLSAPNEYQGSIEYIFGGKAFYNYKDLSSSETTKMYKLDEVKIKYQGEPIYVLKFDYTNNSSERLKLLALNYANKNGEVNSTYAFTYNQTALPGYNSGKEDLLGYYNGVFYFGNFTSNSNFTYSQLLNNYLPTREPNSQLMGAESLIKITFPEKGYIEYEYEPNSYSAYIGAWDHTLNTLSNSKMAGGLRIWRIKSDPGNGEPALEKTFLYVKDYQTNPSSTVSSGVLYDDIAAAALRGNSANWQCSHDIMSYRKSAESPITYSEITTLFNNNGYTIQKYSGYNNGQTDNPPFLAGPGSIAYAQTLAPYAYNNKRLSRDKITSEEIFKNDRTILAKTEYIYYHDIEPNPKHLRSIQYYKNVQSTGGTIFSYVAYPQYCFYDYIKSVTKTKYSYQNGSVASMVETATSFYTNNQYQSKLTRSEFFDSKGMKKITEYKYPIDYPNEPIYAEMTTNRNMIGKIIDEISYQDNSGTLNELSRKHTKYELSAGGIINPKMQLSTIKGQAINLLDNSQIDIQFDLFDSRGRLLQLTDKNGLIESNIWDPNLMFITAKVANAAYADIAYTSFENGGTGNWSGINSSNVYFDPTSPTGKRCYRTVGGSLISKGLDGNKKYILSYWSKSGPVPVYYCRQLPNLPSMQYIGFGPSTSQAGQNGWVYYEHLVQNTGTINIGCDLSNGICGMQVEPGIYCSEQYIDELRLYPQNSMMVSTTYEPLIGLTSHCDANNRITYNEYDGFGRLIVTRDQNRNIIKRFCYNFKGQQENCAINTAPQWQSTNTYRCALNTSGENTGYQERQERDNNQFSPTYYQTRWVDNGYNPSACPPPYNCNYGNCYWEGYSCVYGQCEQGYRVNTYSYYDDSMGQYVCVYHYEFSDGSWSSDYYEYSYWPSCYQQ